MSASKHRIYFLLQRAAHRLKTQADSALSETGGLTTAQAAVMTIIAKDGPITQKFIAETLMLRESAITAMVNRLRKAGYISRLRSKRDARAWELEATELGRNALEQMRETFDTVNAKLDALMNEDEIAQFAARLCDILDAFDD